MFGFDVKKLADLLSKKNVELSAQDLAGLIEDKPEVPPAQTSNIDTTELKHNKEIINELQKQLDDVKNAMVSKDKANQSEVEDLKKTIKDLTTTLVAEKENRDAAIKKTQEELEAKRLEEKKNNIKTMLDNAIAAKKIAPQDTETLKIYEGLADKDIDNTKTLIDKLPTLTSASASGTSTDTTNIQNGTEAFNRVTSGVQTQIKDYVLKNVQNIPQSNQNQSNQNLSKI